jgi:hypothetical protein
MPEVARVIWIVKGKAKTELLFKRMKKVLGDKSSKHIFVYLSDFEKYNWGAKIQFGKEAGYSIAYVLRDPNYDKYNMNYTHPFLESAKFLFNPVVY